MAQYDQRRKSGPDSAGGARCAGRRHRWYGIRAGVAPVLLLLLVGSSACGSSRQGRDETELTVAAASDLKFALDDIVRAFRSRDGDVNVRVTYGSSGNFAAQLRNEAPFDLFLSADLMYPRQLKAQDRVLDGSEFTYAIGRLVLWTTSQPALDVEQMRIDTLRDPAVRHVAIANPAHAPYGRAAEAAMRSLGVYESVRHKLVLGENIAQAFQFVQSGAAEVGIVALPLVLGSPAASQGRYWEIPADAYPRLQQGGAIMKAARNVDAAWKFRAFLLASTARDILRRHGFSLPES